MGGNCIKLIHKKLQNDVKRGVRPLAAWRLHTWKLQALGGPFWVQ